MPTGGIHVTGPRFPVDQSRTLRPPHKVRGTPPQPAIPPDFQDVFIARYLRSTTDLGNQPLMRSFSALSLGLPQHIVSQYQCRNLTPLSKSLVGRHHRINSSNAPRTSAGSDSPATPAASESHE